MTTTKKVEPPAILVEFLKGRSKATALSKQDPDGLLSCANISRFKEGIYPVSAVQALRIERASIKLGEPINCLDIITNPVERKLLEDAFANRKVFRKK